MNKDTYKIPEIAVLLFCAWLSRDLISSWKSTPFLLLDPLNFFLWISPVVAFWLFPPENPKITKQQFQTNYLFMGLALLFSLIGKIGDLHVSTHIGLMFALSGFLPWSLCNILWMISALSWMPSVAYFARGFPSYLIIFGRFILAIIGAIVEFRTLYKKQRANEK